MRSSTHGALDAAELPSRYLPSLATQRARQAKLPDRATLAAALAEASRDLPFRADLFAPFLDDVETARTLPPLTAEEFARSPLGARLASMLVQRDDGWLALATLSGVHDADALDAFTRSTNGAVRLLDLKGASESLVVAYRERILRALGIALVLLALTVIVALRSARRAWHVLAPMSLATLLVLVVERASGISLSLFHLVALTLAAGPRPALRAVLRAAGRRCGRSAPHAARDAGLRRLGAARVRHAGVVVAAGAARDRAHGRARRRVPLLPVDPDGASRRRRNRRSTSG